MRRSLLRAIKTDARDEGTCLAVEHHEAQARGGDSGETYDTAVADGGEV